jgi:hypothetical protein
MTKVTDALKAFGVAGKDLQTRQLTVSRIDWGANKGKYEAVNQVEVRMRAVDKVGEAVAATTQAGANVLSGPTLRVSDQEAATKSAYASAYRAARARADAYAGAAGLKIDRVLTIRDGGDGAPPLAYEPTPPIMKPRHNRPRRPSTPASANRRYRCASSSRCRRNRRAPKAFASPTRADYQQLAWPAFATLWGKTNRARRSSAAVRCLSARRPRADWRSRGACGRATICPI